MVTSCTTKEFIPPVIPNSTKNNLTPSVSTMNSFSAEISGAKPFLFQGNPVTATKSSVITITAIDDNTSVTNGQDDTFIITLPSNVYSGEVCKVGASALTFQWNNNFFANHSYSLSSGWVTVSSISSSKISGTFSATFSNGTSYTFTASSGQFSTSF